MLSTCFPTWCASNHIRTCTHVISTTICIWTRLGKCLNWIFEWIGKKTIPFRWPFRSLWGIGQWIFLIFFGLTLKETTKCPTLCFSSQKSLMLRAVLHLDKLIELINWCYSLIKFVLIQSLQVVIQQKSGLNLFS